MINARGIIVVALATLLLASIASAKGDPAPDKRAWSCQEVRAGVERYGYAAAQLWARLNGYSAREIEQAKRCLAK